jgi:hypothetical protein
MILLVLIIFICIWMILNQKYNKLADEAVSISDSIIVYDLIKKEEAKEKLTSEVTNESK